MRKYILLFLFALPLFLSAQTKQPALKPYLKDDVKDAKKEADDMFKSQGFNQAIKIYERLIITDPNNAEYNYKLGLCYLNTNINKAKAIPMLEYAANANTKDKPKDVLFDLARAYHYAGLYDKAIEYFEKYRVEKKGSVDAKLKFNDWVDWSTSAKTLTANPVNVKFENLGKTINSPSADYRPVMGVSDTIIYFASKRKGNTGGLTDDLGDVTSDVYFFLQNDTSRSKAKNAGVNLNTAFYEEAMYINPYGDKMLLYRESPESNGDIYIAQLKGKQWDKPVSLGKDFITKTMETGACMSPDGLTLYFSAEMAGSKTGKDIYKCTRTESTGWSKPTRLGDKINSNGDEDNPYMWIDGKTFFFSSTGHGSMGGYDLFKSVLASSNEDFSTPENLGFPINSAYDDIGFALEPDGKTFYVSAVRDSGLGDYDIYKATTDKPLTSNPMVWIQGVAMTSARTPAKGAFVVVTNATTGDKIANCESNDATGHFDIAVPAGSYKVTLRHAKLGKADADITVDPTIANKVYLEIKFQ